MAPYALGRYACLPAHCPRTTAHGPLLQRRETSLSDGFPVTRFMLFEQAAVNQKRDAALAHFDQWLAGACRICAQALSSGTASSRRAAKETALNRLTQLNA
jgi:hypothetical protein